MLITVDLTRVKLNFTVEDKWITQLLALTSLLLCFPRCYSRLLRSLST